MRADAADRERARLADENLRLVRELEAARQWLGAPRLRLMLFAGMLVVGSALVAAGHALGHATATCPRCPVPPPEHPPRVTGRVTGNNGRDMAWELYANRCGRHEENVELTSTTNREKVWITARGVELDVGTDILLLANEQCTELRYNVWRNGDMVDGYVDFECTVDGNRMGGRIDFQNCQ
jgi:hypothetical protein